MLEYYYTLLMLASFSGMLLYSRSIPVSLLSLYIVFWFFPQGIRFLALGMEINILVLLGLAELMYLLYFYSRQKEDYDRTLMNTSIRYVISISAFYLLIAFMSTDMPIGMQLKSLIGFILYAFNIIIATSLYKKKEIECLFHFTAILVIISGIYGIYTYVIQFNPFAEFVVAFHSAFEDQGMSSSSLETERGFLHGRISGFTVHPLLYGGVLVLCFFFLLSYYNQINSKWQKTILLLILSFCLVLIILTGSRSILIGLLCGLFYYYFKRNPQLFLRFSLLGAILVFVFGLSIEDEYIRSILFFWEEHDEIKGSSSTMRYDQMAAAIDIISENVESFLFGLGRGWTYQYSLKYGNIPPFHGFESIFLFSLIEFGVLGTIIYLFLIFSPLYKHNKNAQYDDQFKTLINAFLFSGFVIYAFTGHVYGQWLYIVLCFLMIQYGSLTVASNSQNDNE